jgi:predicted ester cyclase
VPEPDLHDYPRTLYGRWNDGDIDGFCELIAEDVEDRTGGVTGRDAVRAILEQVLAAFPDHHYEVEDVVVDGDVLAVRLTAGGTQHGDFFGYPATGRRATWTEMRMVRIVDGRTAEHWANVDTLGMLSQLGHLSPPDRSNW